MRVLVTGATGKTGRPLVDALAGRGVEVRAASRHPGPGTGTAVHFGERQVRESGRDWTILRPNWFMQNFGSLFVGSLRDHGHLALPAGDAAVSFVDTRDIAAVAAASLTEAGHAGRVYTLTGPEALTHDEVVALLGAAAGRDLRYVPVEPDDFAGHVREGGASDTVITWQSALFELIRNGVNSPATSTVEKIACRLARSLTAYAEESADAWRRPSPVARPAASAR